MNKLLLRTSARELHSNLFKPETGLPEIAVEDGRKQISDTVFRSVLPSELRETSKHLKELCCCRVCKPMSFRQDAMNQWRRKKRHQLRVRLDWLPEGLTRAEREAREAAGDGLDLSGKEASVGGQCLHPTPRDTTLSVWCAPLAEFLGSGLKRLCHSAGWCENRPCFERPAVEFTASNSINFSVILLFPFAASVLCCHLKPKSVLPAWRRKMPARGGRSAEEITKHLRRNALT